MGHFQMAVVVKTVLGSHFGDCEVHWGYDLDVDPWPDCSQPAFAPNLLAEDTQSCLSYTKRETWLAK